MPVYSFNPGRPIVCLICNEPMQNPTRTQKVHQTGPCKAKFDEMRYAKEKEQARLRYANAKRAGK